MIYCVVPQELEEELYERLVTHYRGNPDVTVILDRRRGSDRRQGEGEGERRERRDRRRARAAGTFPPIGAPGD